MGRLGYCTHQALRSIRESLGVSLLSTLTIGVALLLLSGYAMGLRNLERLALIWGRSAPIAAALAETLPQSEWEVLRARVAAHRGVAQAVLVTPAARLERFAARGPEAQALIAGIDSTLLPPAIEVSLQDGFTELSVVAQLAAELKQLPGVSEVDYGQDEFRELERLLAFLRSAGLLGALLIGVAAALIVANTIRLAVYARRDEIAILRLVGATRWFVRLPFLIEGSLWGLCGGLLAATCLYVFELLLATEASRAVAEVLGGLEVQLFAPDIALGVVGLGIGLGALGSALAVRRFLDAVPT